MRGAPGRVTFLEECRQAWRPGLVAMVGGALCWQMWLPISSLFVEPLQAAHGWTRGQIAYVQSVVIFTVLAAPLIGRMSDRWGVRPILAAGISVMAAGYLGFAFMGHSLPAFFAIFTVFALAGVSTTGLTFTRIVSHAFRIHRGTALAVSRLGVAAITVIGPPTVYLLLTATGLRATLVALAALLVAVPLALVLLYAPRRREEHPAAAQASAQAGWMALIRRPKVLLLALAAGLNYGPVLALLANFKPIGVAKGVDPAFAVSMISVIGISAGLGAVACGLLIDRYWAPGVAFVTNLLPAAGCFALAMSEGSPTMLFVCAALIGLGQGAENDLVAFMIARYFGLRNYSAIYGLTIIPMGAFVALIGSFNGWSFDRFGHYDFGLLMAGATFTLASFAYLAMGRYPEHPVDDPVEPAA